MEFVFGEIRVVFTPERGASHAPATVRVFRGDELLKAVVVEIDSQQGADGGYYHVVTFRENT